MALTPQYPSSVTLYDAGKAKKKLQASFLANPTTHRVINLIDSCYKDSGMGRKMVQRDRKVKKFGQHRRS